MNDSMNEQNNSQAEQVNDMNLSRPEQNIAQTEFQSSNVEVDNNAVNGDVPNSSKKGFNHKLIIILIIILILLLLLFLLFANKKKTNDEVDSNGSNINEKVESSDDSNAIDNNSSSKTACAGNKKELNGLKYKTVDDYYNIDTSKFDKNKFNGDIDFYGVKLSGKITANSVRQAGITIFKQSSFDGNVPRDVNYYDWMVEKGKTFIRVYLKHGDRVLTHDTTGDVSFTLDDFYFYNMDNEKNLDSNNTLFSTDTDIEYNLNIHEVYPSILQVSKANEITIDLLLEKLGNPTYVYERASKCLKNEYSYTTYIYVYDDVAFLFSFANWENMKIGAVYYYPIEVVNASESQELINKWTSEYNS